MKDRHFEQLSAQTGIQMALKPAITFKSLLILGIQEFEELVKIVADIAAKEYATERTLNKMIEEWEMIVLELLPYKTTGKCFFFYYICSIDQKLYLYFILQYFLSTVRTDMFIFYT